MKPISKLLPSQLLAAVVSLGVCGQAMAGEVYGLGQQWIFLAAENFRPLFPACDLTLFTGSGVYNYYRIVSQSGGTCVASPMQVRTHLELPEGAAINVQRLYYYNTNTKLAISSGIEVFSTDDLAGTNPNEFPLVSDWTTANSVGYSAKQLNIDPAITFNSYDNTTAVARRRSYYVIVNLPNDPNVAFQGIAIGYHRQIAPAPATASFADVATNHPFFNEISQLGKSGITLGCGSGNFCPDAPVTRGQMAVFLSRALGLHWGS